MQNLAPIALFVYNRPQHTERTIKFLQQNLLAADSRLYIFSDGAKTQADEDKVNEVRSFIKSVEGFKSVKVIESKSNKGLANSIIEGVTQLNQNYGQVIVFEDDLVSSPHTLTYFNEALNRYREEEKVMHIGAYMYHLQEQNLPESFFYRAATSWGWATWQRAAGTPTHELQKLGGWKNGSMVERYAHLSSDHLVASAKRIEKMLPGYDLAT